mmetsp:Transcript_31995/g.50108  ORF Transcript_31995/g.50108 Transcript_31995/m.50108 type:complete len:214 (-) Transcript_31995:171-812(-)
MCDHNHGHGHGHGGCKDEHISVEEQEGRDKNDLYPYIDNEKAFCLNEEEPGSVRNIFKPFDKRMDKTKFLRSDCDEELIIHIPFTGSVKLTSICIIGMSEGSSAAKLKLFKNNSTLDFSSAESAKPVQEINLQPDLNGVLDYPVSVAHFQSATSILLYIPSNFGEDQTEISYIGLKGSCQKLNRQPVIATYEARANRKDHQVPQDEKGFSSIS